MGPQPHGLVEIIPFRFTAWDKESSAMLLKRCSIPFPCNQRANNKRPMGKWVHDHFGESRKSPLLSSLNGKRDNAASKKQRSREWPPQHTEKRGSQSISSPSRVESSGWKMHPVTARQPPTEINKECGQTTDSMRDWTDKHLKFKWVNGNKRQNKKNKKLAV